MAIEIGNRRELLCDDYFVEHLSGGARLNLQYPIPRKTMT